MDTSSRQLIVRFGVSAVTVALVTLAFQNCADNMPPNVVSATGGPSTGPGPNPGPNQIPSPNPIPIPPPNPIPNGQPTLAQSLLALVRPVYRSHAPNIGHNFRLDQNVSGDFVLEGIGFYVFDRTSRPQLEAIGVGAAIIPVYRCLVPVTPARIFLSPLENCESTNTVTFQPLNDTDAGGTHLLGYVFRDGVATPIPTLKLWRCYHPAWNTHLTTPLDVNPADNQPDECVVANSGWTVEFVHGQMPKPSN